MFVTPYGIVLACAVAALAVCPPKLQIVVVLGVFAYLAYSLRGDPVAKKESSASARYKYPAEAVVDRPCTGQADKFADATEAVRIVTGACDKFDAKKGAEIAAELDTCIDEYMRVLNGQKASYSSHVLSRDKVYDIMAQCYVVTDEAAVPELDKARGLLDSLFSTFDVVLHRDGKADRPGPQPNRA
jgi:hypothetical protein